MATIWHVYNTDKSLFGTHNTVEFLVGVIRPTRKTIAVCFNMIEESSICIGLTSWQHFHFFIYTLKTSALVPLALSHEVAIILSGPSIRTAVFSRNGDDGRPCRDLADSTWYVVIINFYQALIFHSMYSGMILCS